MTFPLTEKLNICICICISPKIMTQTKTLKRMTNHCLYRKLRSKTVVLNLFLLKLKFLIDLYRPLKCLNVVVVNSNPDMFVTSLDPRLRTYDLRGPS